MAEAQRNGLLCMPDIVTNGVFDAERRDWMIANFEHVTISMDGPREVHDQLRRHPDGHGSFDEAFENAKAIHESGVRFGIRIIVSSANVALLPQIVEFFHREFPGCRLGIEPMEECGRCEVTGIREPDPIEYAQQFIRAYALSLQMGGRIKNSVTRFKYGDSTCYCGANGLNFAVNYEGFVTSCTRVTCQSHPASRWFYYGRFDTKRGGFIFDQEAYASHAQYVVQSIRACDGCFARHSCKGGCLHLKANLHPGNFWTTPLDDHRCEAMRFVTTGLLRLQLGLSVN